MARSTTGIVLIRGRVNSTRQSNAEYAAVLYVSHATVETHVSRLLMKLDARDRAQLVMVAYETGVVKPGTT